MEKDARRIVLQSGNQDRGWRAGIEKSKIIKRGAEIIVKELSTIEGQCVLGQCQWYDWT